MWHHMDCQSGLHTWISGKNTRQKSSEVIQNQVFPLFNKDFITSGRNNRYLKLKD